MLAKAEGVQYANKLLTKISEHIACLKHNRSFERSPEGQLRRFVPWKNENSDFSNLVKIILKINLFLKAGLIYSFYVLLTVEFDLMFSLSLFGYAKTGVPLDRI